MTYLLRSATLLFCLFILRSAHAQHAPAWPHNPTTGKVEFRGTLPWPAGVEAHLPYFREK